MMPWLMLHWRASLEAVIGLVLAFSLALVAHQRDVARHGLERERAASAQFAADVAATSARIRADMAAHALSVERRQSQITQEVSNDYQARIADLRRRAAALRVHHEPTAGANPGSSGSDLPGVPGAAGGPDAAAAADGLSAEGAVIATEQAIQLEELQNWIRRQAEVPR